MRLLYHLLILLLFVSCNGFVEVELSNSSEGGKPLLSLIVTPTYSSFSNFLEYTQPDGLGCDPATDTDCVHGGEKRQALLTGYSSCLNITGSDSLGVFEWECDGTTNPVTLRIKDFNQSKGLADLIDGSTNSFKNIYLSVFEDSVEIARSSTGQWWTNTIKELPENSGPADFSLTIDNGTYTEGDILIFKTSRSSIGYNLNMNKIALVGMNGATMTWISNDPNRRNCSNAAEPVDNSFESLCLIASGTQNFIWIEGKFMADKNEANAQPNILFFDNKYSRVHNFTSFQCRGSCVFTQGDFNKVTDGTVGRSNDIGLNHGSCSNCLFEDILTTGNDNLGVLGFNSTNVILNRITGIQNNGFIRIQAGNVGMKVFNVYGFNNSGDCIYDPFGDVVFVNVFCSNNITGGGSIRIQANNTTIVNVFNFNESASAGTSSNGTSMNYSIISSGQLEVASSTTLVNVLGINVSGAGLNYYSTTNSVVYDAYVTDSNFGLRYQNNSTNNNFVGDFYFGNNSTCSFQDGTSVTGNQIDSGCDATVGGINIAAGTTSQGLLRGLVNDDSTNANTNNLVSDIIAHSDVTDWQFFDSPYRNWGKNGNLLELVDTNNKGSCDTAGSCAMWDGRFVTGAMAPKNPRGEIFTPGAPCPASGNSSNINNVVQDSYSVSRTFLRYATEIVMDGVGNDNGLCESGEDCLWSPNYGAYQGEGDYMTQGKCNFSGGNGVTGVNLYAYPNNE